MNVARMNFSHGTHEYHAQTIANLRATCLKTDKLCAVMLDTKGPEIRTIKLKGAFSAEPCPLGHARRPTRIQSFPTIISMVITMHTLLKLERMPVDHSTDSTLSSESFVDID